MASREHFVRIDDRRLGVVAHGPEDGPTVLLIHGAAAHAHWWDAIVPAFAPPWRALAVDLRGHGASDSVDPPAYQIEDFGTDLLRVVDELTPAPVVVVGHSMGGRVALWLAAERPDRVRGLALLDVRVYALAAERADQWRGRVVTPGRAPRGYPSRAAAMAAFKVTPDEPGIAPETMAHLAAHAVRERGPDDWVMRFDRAVLDVTGSRVSDFLPLCERVRCPSLVVIGADSDVVGPKQAAKTSAALGGAPIRTVPGKHHFPLAEPAATGVVLRAFLDGLA